MPITQALNSKANVKKPTGADLPFSPQQPVIAKYGPVESTLSQTVINLSFSVDTTNSAIFMLSVDGKMLSEGASYDYTFTSVAADGTSSQVTLTQALPAGLNIQAWKLGLKKESEFGMDNRFTQMYEASAIGFQGFINNTSFLITATSNTGTPAAGTFHSTITNRAPLIDPSQDLKPRMGIERIMTQQLYQIQNEYGSSGEQVWGTPNDTLGQIRFAGLWTNTLVGISGEYAQTSSTSDFCEITFFGTGLNVLTVVASSSADYRYTLDGGTETQFIVPGTSYSNFLTGRNYNTNSPATIVSGLTLGVHTVKIRAQATNMVVYGFEILNESSSVKVQPGVSYIQDKKLSSAAQSTFTYNSVATGTRGGRVLVYQASDGTIGKAWQAVNASSANLASADHTNEELVRQYSFREFGAARSDDFSLLTSSSGNKAFTLDDGTTTLVGTNVRTLAAGVEALNFGQGSTADTMTFTFVGTGLDVIWTSDGTATSVAVNVDGSSIGTFGPPVAATTPRIQKIVSGLPYGTHTVKFASSNTTASVAIANFKVYQPKKPTLPSGAVELADYNVMANFAANSVQSAETISTGILRKCACRELIYVGSWSAALDQGTTGGFQGLSGGSGTIVKYSFFGTGFDYRWTSTATAQNFTVNVDGSTTLSAFTTSVYGAGISFTAATGVVGGTSSGTQKGNGVVVSGLALGLHTVTFTLNNANFHGAEAFDIITPIHSTKSNLHFDLQNSLPVGSCGVSDNRKTSPVRESLSTQKPWVQAVGVTSSPTNSSSSYVPIPEMSVNIKANEAGAIEIAYSVVVTGSTAGTPTFQVYMDGVAIGQITSVGITSAGFHMQVCDNFIVPVSAGVHKIDLYCLGSGPTTTTFITNRRTIKARVI